jgi:dUTP pyrophosphatase
MTLVKVKRLRGMVPMPAYQTPGSAGMDLCAAIDGPVWLQPGERRLVPTGVALEIPEGYEGQVRARSGLALKSGLGMVNGVGTIDSDYRGEVGLLLVNLGFTNVKIEPLMRCGQLVICPVVRAELVEVDSLDDTRRGAKGFGSTGSSGSMTQDIKPHATKTQGGV